MLDWVEHYKSFITSGPDCPQKTMAINMMNVGGCVCVWGGGGGGGGASTIRFRSITLQPLEIF